jgi:hypothetical protein
MQSISPSLTTPSRSPARAWAAISTGSSPHGHAFTQLAQRMQGMVSPRRVSVSVRASSPFAPLTVGTRALGSGCPIMGPPLMSRVGSTVNPPQ